MPEVRDPIKLQRMAASRLGKDVVSVVNAFVTYANPDGDKEVLKDVTWLIGPGERTGILGANGAGKSTLLKLITGELEATRGYVKRGTTVRVASLSQHLVELDDWADQRVATVLKQYSSVKLADGSELTPGQLLERVGFDPAQLKTVVGALSGGQRRRLQLLVVLLSEPNVLVLDEPTNDLDTDMLASLEDLLDSWPGTLIVVSHDRYLMERVTDQQYAVHRRRAAAPARRGRRVHRDCARTHGDGRRRGNVRAGVAAPMPAEDPRPAAAAVRPASEPDSTAPTCGQHRRKSLPSRDASRSPAAEGRAERQDGRPRPRLTTRGSPPSRRGCRCSMPRPRELEDRWLDLTDRLG